MVDAADLPISIIHYEKGGYTIKKDATPEDCKPFRDKPGGTWINVDTVGDPVLLHTLGNIFDLHDLTVKDIANTDHRVKYEDFSRYLLIILKMLDYKVASKSINAKQLSLILAPDFVITFQEASGDYFGAIREEIKIEDSVIRKMGSDYLACRIIDTIVDNYFSTIEEFGNEIEDKEDLLVDNPTKETLNSIRDIKKHMLQLRQYVWPVREILSDLSKKNSPLIKDDTIAYFRDVYDRLFEAMDLIETAREMVAGLIDIYLSSMSNRTNEVMKVLTVVATIFIPLTFVVGLYGMNFKFMPELESPYGYPVILLLMLAIAVVMLIYFRRKKWI